MNKNKEKQEEIIEKMLDEILKEEDYQKRFQLIQQLDLFTMTAQRIFDIDTD